MSPIFDFLCGEESQILWLQVGASCSKALEGLMMDMNNEYSTICVRMLHEYCSNLGRQHAYNMNTKCTQLQTQNFALDNYKLKWWKYSTQLLWIWKRTVKCSFTYTVWILKEVLVLLVLNRIHNKSHQKILSLTSLTIVYFSVLLDNYYQDK